MAMAAPSPAREVAFDILLNVERGEAHSDELLRATRVDALSAPDRNLTTTLVLGVLRWQLRLDEAIKAHLAKPNAKLDAEVRTALRLGAFQLLFLDRIPAHAAIDESVELAKRAGHRFAAGMVNAVLRRISRVDYLERGIEESSPVGAYPAWMVERWERCYGADAACAICAHGQRQPRLSLRLTGLDVDDELARAGVEMAPGELLAGARTILGGDMTPTAAFREGRARIQDEGSQLVGEIAASLVPNPEQKQMPILDACAAPGGKTLILAERHQEARIVACEASPQRLAAMQERVAALCGQIECRLADAAALGEASVYDLALADVPCSGTGTLGRNPEIRHRLRAEDLARQAERQRAILRAMLHAVRPGGRVVYSTCSLEPEENEQVVAAVLAENPNVRQFPAAEGIHDLRSQGILTAAGAERLAQCFTPQGALRLLPGLFGTDGFFVAVLERSG